MESSVILAWLGLVATLVGIPLTYLLARRGRQRPDLRLATDFDVIIKSEDGILDRLHIDFDGDKILGVSRTRIALWNARGDTVRGSDIVPTDQLRLQLDSDDLALHVRIIAVSREQIDAGCVIDASDPTAVVVSFDFLDASDGFVLEILHKVPIAAELAGTIRGAGVPIGKSADLSPQALDRVTQRWYERLKDWRSLLLPVYISLVALSFAGFTLTFFLKSRSSSAATVDTSNFDLNELSGQRLFAKAVSEAGNVEIPTELLLATGVMSFLAIILLVMTIVRFAKAVIPRSILSVRYGSTVRNDPNR